MKNPADVEAGGEATEHTPLLEGSKNDEVDPALGFRRQGHSAEEMVSTAMRIAGLPNRAIRSFIDNLFDRKVNVMFADHAELACRAGLYIVALLLPGKFELGYEFRNVVSSARVLTPEATVQFVYTLYLTVGQTIYFAWCGIFGSVLGSVYPWAMFGIYPHGVHEADHTDPAFLAGIFLGSVFVVTVLFLNFDILTKIFALSTFVWHWMGFLQPGSVGLYSTGFNFYWDGAMVRGLIAAVSGSILAVICTIVPYPLLATDKACFSAGTIVSTVGSSWNTAALFICGSRAEPFELMRLEKFIGIVNSEMMSLKMHIDNCWWECFGFSGRHRRRKMLERLNAIIYETCERLTSIVMACSIEDFAESHVVVMQRVKTQLFAVTDGAQNLLVICTELACQGQVVSAETQAKVQDDMKDLVGRLEDLAQAFHAAKKEAKLPGLSEEMLSEHAFCFAASNYAHIAMHFAEFLCDPNFDDNNHSKRGLLKAFVDGVRSVFDPKEIFDRMHLNWALKNSLAVLICFAVGYIGYSKMILRYSAGIASTCSVLLSKFSGSAMKKNLSRLQGVVIGLVLGELGYAMLGWCVFYFKMIMLITLGFWLSFTLFFYYDSPAYGGITCLMAAFGTKYFLKPCSDTVVDPTRSYYEIINVVICIVFMTIIDHVFSLGRPSCMAYESINSAWGSISVGVSDIMDALKPDTRRKSGGIRKSIAEAKYLGSEALEEPRMWRTPWQQNIFAAATLCATEVRVNLSNMEFSVANHDISHPDEDAPAPKSKLFTDMMERRQFIEIRRLLLSSFKSTSALLPVLLHEEQTEFPYLMSAEMQDDVNKAAHGLINALIKNLNEDPPPAETQNGDGAKDLTLDTDARISIVLMSVLGMLNSMTSLRKAAIRGG